tara:strand:+ start:270 stop:746 length:477 start_codon:yes stop_codon:yes gene_type:complete
MADTYYNETTKALKTFSEIKADYPTTSWPNPINDTVLEAFGYKPVMFVPMPTPSEATKHCILDGVEFDASVGYKQKWIEEDRFSGDNKDTLDAEYQTQLDTSAASNVRRQRNQLLEETDWWAVSDRTMSDEEKTYRQLLRDLPTASGFPYTMTFPTKP